MSKLPKPAAKRAKRAKRKPPPMTYEQALAAFSLRPKTHNGR